MQYPTMPGNTMEIIKIRSFWLLPPPPLVLAQQHEQQEKVVVLVFSHNGNKEIGGCEQKIDFRPKNQLNGIVSPPYPEG